MNDSFCISSIFVLAAITAVDSVCLSKFRFLAKVIWYSFPLGKILQIKDQ